MSATPLQIGARLCTECGDPVPFDDYDDNADDGDDDAAINTLAYAATVARPDDPRLARFAAR